MCLDGIAIFYYIIFYTLIYIGVPALVIYLIFRLTKRNRPPYNLP
jgi:hypothetical protein